MRFKCTTLDSEIQRELVAWGIPRNFVGTITLEIPRSRWEDIIRQRLGH
jgi:hypothetical protein